MTDGIVEVAWIVSGTTLVQFVLSRVFSRMDAREIRRDVIATKDTVVAAVAATHETVIEVAHSVNGMLDARVKAAGDLEHSLGKEEGVNQERDRT